MLLRRLGFVAHGAWFAEQEALREIDREIEQLHDGLLVLHALGDEIEAVAREQTLEIFRGNGGLRRSHAAHKRGRAHLDVTEADRLELAEIERERIDMIHRQRETEACEIAEIGLALAARFRHGLCENSKTICPARSRL